MSELLVFFLELIDSRLKIGKLSLQFCSVKIVILNVLKEAYQICKFSEPIHHIFRFSAPVEYFSLNQLHVIIRDLLSLDKEFANDRSELLEGLKLAISEFL